ncbi:alpha/beta-hydrolase [Gonapodya prolifera JEL478]|uniref:Palmitoyl-protein thioesterase 1 n=1 Tax=Gonapodya prolifera (strain JEL478) TaxID=1344416 RepID=A0A138ZZ37_GONPJ|nr:alpha/beta-hydrolase [Gonapodya prolifera JEL478]|eukprot:KXS09678.1 alpha/beta-hydrolase [Gonapodya prolifera JEL478]
MGDTCCGDSMNHVKELIQDTLPGVYVKSIQVGPDDSADKRAGFLGRLDDQIDAACNDILDDPIIDAANGINLIGFSQGGQFLRALVERCEGMWPYRFISFGGQHAGIADVPSCSSSDSSACSFARRLLRLGAYLPFVQSNVVQAQYYRDPNDYEGYLDKCTFLPDVNNEKEQNEAYKENIVGLDKIVLVRFSQEETVVPAESSWFGWYNATSGEAIPLKETPLYQEDWLGLKEVDERGDLIFETAEGKHMQFSDEYLVSLVEEYFSEDADAYPSKVSATLKTNRARGPRVAAQRAGQQVVTVQEQELDA